MIIDGNSIVNRAFYGIRLLTAPDGTPTNAIYGFLTILHRLVEEEAPQGLCVAFDLKGPTFRHEKFEDYKAGRRPMPDELAQQLPILKEVLDALGVHRLEMQGYEADDLIGTVSVCCATEACECVIVTGDRDSFQLITDTTRVRFVKTRAGQTETINYTPEVFFDEYGFEPRRIIDLKALMGDASDNIPGVKGIGEKTAGTLIRTFGSLEGVYENLDSPEIKASVRTKLEAGKAEAELSFDLATIDAAVPLEFSPVDSLFSGFSHKAFDIFKRLGFNSLILKWGLSKSAASATKPTKPAMQTLPERELSDADLPELKEKLKVSAEPIAVLTGRAGLDELTVCDGSAVYFISRLTAPEGYDDFTKTLFSPQIPKISHNVKDLMRQMLSEKLNIGGFVFDTALAAYLLDPTGSAYELEKLAEEYLGAGLKGAGAVYALYPVLKNKLDSEGLTRLFEEIELPLCPVLADMELTGFLVDRQAISDFGESLSVRIDELQKEIWFMAGEEFNIASTKQLGVILFERLMLPSGKKTKTGWSTNAEVLEGLRDKHQIIDDILEYRKLTKLKSTYTDGLLSALSPDGRIHTSFQMTVTATGRLSSTEPNLQNIPVRTPIGARLREMFVAAPGSLLVDADYSQIELRLLAHISGDETMREAFISGEDIHAVTASQVFNVPLGEVTSLQRSHAKAVNFGIVYGISAFSLSQDIGVFPSEAKEYIDAYLSKYHGVRDYMKSVVEKARADGYVATLFGRRRPLPELKSSNFNVRSFGERVALNMPVQGTAADIIKLAMIRVHERLKREGLTSRLILQVHDELICECPESEVETVKKLLTEEMENAVHYSVPLVAEAHAGLSWSEAK
jgi:DNA polymerase-1